MPKKPQASVQMNAKPNKREKIFIEVESPFIIFSKALPENEYSPADYSFVDPKKQTVKFLDLNKFKIEQCKNLANGK
jgi:hypothetical protein